MKIRTIHRFGAFEGRRLKEYFLGEILVPPGEVSHLYIYEVVFRKYFKCTLRKEFFPNISKILFPPNRFFSEITGWEISHRDKLWHACGILKQIRFCKGIPNSESLLAAPACLQIKVIEQIEFPPKKTKLQKKHHHYCNYQISQLSQRGAKCARGKTTIYSSTLLTDIRYAKGTKDTSTDSSTVAERHTF